MKMNNFRGDLGSISAKMATLIVLVTHPLCTAVADFFPFIIVPTSFIFTNSHKCCSPTGKLCDWFVEWMISRSASFFAEISARSPRQLFYFHYLKNVFGIKKFSTGLQTGGVKKSFGGLKDQDRIFTNLYRDGDPFIEGAMKRVRLL